MTLIRIKIHDRYPADIDMDTYTFNVVAVDEEYQYAEIDPADLPKVHVLYDEVAEIPAEARRLT